MNSSFPSRTITVTVTLVGAAAGAVRYLRFRISTKKNKNENENENKNENDLQLYALRESFVLWKEHDGKQYCAQIEDATSPGSKVILKLKAGSLRRFGTWAPCTMRKKSILKEQPGLQIMANEEELLEHEEPLLRALHERRLDVGQAQDMAFVLLQQLDRAANDPTGVTRKCHSLFDDILKAFIAMLDVPLEGRPESGAGAYIQTINKHLPELLSAREKENWKQKNDQRNFITHNSEYEFGPAAAATWLRFLGVDVMTKLYNMGENAVQQQLQQKLREEAVLVQPTQAVRKELVCVPCLCQGLGERNGVL